MLKNCESCLNSLSFSLSKLQILDLAEAAAGPRPNSISFQRPGMMYHFKVLLNIAHLQWPFLLLSLFSSCITPFGVSVSLESLEKKMRTGTGLSAHLSGTRQRAADYLGRFFRISTSEWANVRLMPGLQGVLYILYRTAVEGGHCGKLAKRTNKLLHFTQVLITHSICFILDNPFFKDKGLENQTSVPNLSLNFPRHILYL